MCRTLALPAKDNPLPVILNPSSEGFSPNPVTSEELPSFPQPSTSPVFIPHYTYCSNTPPASLRLPLSSPPRAAAGMRLGPFHYYYYYYLYCSHFPLYFPWPYTPFFDAEVPFHYFYCDGPIRCGDYAKAAFDPYKGGPLIADIPSEEVVSVRGGNENDRKSWHRIESDLGYSIEGFPNRRRTLQKSTRHFNNPKGRYIVASQKRRHSSKARGKFEWKPKNNGYPFGDSTTLMIRNIPNRLSRRELLELLDAHCQEENKKAEKCYEPTPSEFDFVYLPVDFKRNLNYGFAFVNFTNVEGAFRLLKSWTGRKWVQCGYNSKKKCEISRAYIQGKEELRKKFERSLFACSTDEYLPVELLPPGNGWSRAELITIGRRHDAAAATANTD
ncbi:hypothetical protein Ancab_036567 [Ancistrocladus abbreviatus]